MSNWKRRILCGFRMPIIPLIRSLRGMSFTFCPPEATLKEFARVCKPGGLLIIPTYIDTSGDTVRPTVRLLELLGLKFSRRFDEDAHASFFPVARISRCRILYSRGMYGVRYPAHFRFTYSTFICNFAGRRKTILCFYICPHTKISINFKLIHI